MRNDQWDTIAFNGYYKQYFFKPIEVEVGNSSSLVSTSPAST